MHISVFLLAALGFLILFGSLQRVLDRMGLTDRQALFFVVLMIAGSLLPDIPLGEHFTLNIGGGLIPIALCVYLFFKAGTAWERVRTVLAAILGGALVYLLGRWLPAEPERVWLPDLWIYGLSAGVLALLLGRSRRAAFVAGIMGVFLGDLAQGLISLAQGYDVTIAIGGAGLLDAALIAGIVAVALAELVGETRERLAHAKHEGLHYHNGHFERREEA